MEESSSWGKFLSFGSQLFFANEFYKQEFFVELILASEKSWNKKGQKTPDLLVLKDEQKFLIEVARISGDETKKEIPYLIALDIQQDFIFPERLVSLLFGKRCHFTGSQPQYSEPSIVSDAKARGWQEFLENVGFSQQTQSPVTQPGLLISNEITSKNVTGIIAKIRGELHYLPNLFAEEAINSLDIHALVPGKKA